RAELPGSDLPELAGSLLVSRRSFPQCVDRRVPPLLRRPHARPSRPAREPMSPRTGRWQPMKYPKRTAARFFAGVACLAVLVLPLLSPRLALADAAACAQDHEEGQREANAGHMRNAVRLFMKCSTEATCPALIRQDCAEFFQTAKRSLSSVVFGAQDE